MYMAVNKAVATSTASILVNVDRFIKRREEFLGVDSAAAASRDGGETAGAAQRQESQHAKQA